jgi:hypothetical protein
MLCSTAILSPVSIQATMSPRSIMPLMHPRINSRLNSELSPILYSWYDPHTICDLLAKHGERAPLDEGGAAEGASRNSRHTAPVTLSGKWIVVVRQLWKAFRQPLSGLPETPTGQVLATGWGQSLRSVTERRALLWDCPFFVGAGVQALAQGLVRRGFRWECST